MLPKTILIKNNIKIENGKKKYLSTLLKVTYKYIILYIYVNTNFNVDKKVTYLYLCVN